MINYLIYPLKTMNITQGYLGEYSHKPSYQGKPQSFPWDDGEHDGGRDYMYCPCDEMIIKRIYGLGNAKASNTIWLQSTTKVQTPTFYDYVTLMVVHPNDDDISKLKVGQKFKRGQAIVREGTSGQATGNHFHFEIAQGLFSELGNGWVKNSLGAWVISKNARKPEDCFFNENTTIKKGFDLIKLWNIPVKRDTNKAQVEVLTYNLRLRKEPNGEVLGYIKAGIHDIIENGEWLKVNNGYIAKGEWLKVLPIVNDTAELKKLLIEKEDKIILLQKEVKALQEEINNVAFTFTADRDSYYRVKMYKNEILQIKKLG